MDFEKRVIYYDHNYCGSWISERESISIREFFISKKFSVKNAKELTKWMAKVIKNKIKDTVVIFSKDIVPDIIAEERNKSATIWRYLISGGKVVWMGDIPFYYQGKPNIRDKKKLPVWGKFGLEVILGVKSGEDKLKPVSITSEGTKAGLKTSWNGFRPVKISYGLIPLATTINELGEKEANAWVNWRFIRLYDISKASDLLFNINDYLKEVYNIAIFPLDKIREVDQTKNDIFIVHGHDEKAVNEIKDILIKFGLRPRFLRDFGSGSESLLSKLEKAKKCSYAIVILTPDDVGCKANIINKLENYFKQIVFKGIRTLRVEAIMDEIFNTLKARARQNVIFELGFFKSAFGDKKVSILLKKDKEKDWDYPSDIRGGYYMDMNTLYMKKKMR